MRVIRTELFFNELDDQDAFLKFGPFETERSVSIAWCKRVNEFNPDFQVIAALKDAGIVEGSFQIDSGFTFIDATLSNRRYQVLPPGMGRIVEHDKEATQILNEPIVIEHSPPTVESLNALLGKATPLAGGLYLGLQLADGNYIMMVTVPLGILLVGTAVAITKAIEVGLLRAVTGRGAPTPRSKRTRGRRDDESGSPAARA